MSDLVFHDEFENTNPGALQGIEGFPYQKFQDQRTVYDAYANWVSGAALNNQMQSGESSKEVDLYPLRINPLPTTIQKHVTTLLGEPEDDGRTPVYTKMVLPNEADDSTKQLAADTEEFLNHVWWENTGRAQMLYNAMLSHIYGGCVFKASYTPWDKERKYPLRIDAISPRNFVGYPMGSDHFRLREAWYATEMLASEAKQWGYTGSEEVVWYAEHWKANKYEVFIDGQPAKVKWPGTPTDFKLGGKNPFSFVPFVYIPHIRYNEFLGTPISSNVKGMIKELNLRYGDYGDAVNDDAHSVTAMRNTVNPKNVTIGNLKVIDLGNKSTMTSGEGEPDMWEVNTQKASTAMKDLLNAIWDQYRRDAFVPAVSDGEDEGSQRSGLTLAIRFWPLTSHVKLERFYWSTALDIFQGYLLKIAKEKNFGDITDKNIEMRMKHIWPPMLPRDREIDVQEWVNRASNNLASIETLLEKAGDVEDIKEERDKILDWIRDIKEIEAELAQKYPPINSFGAPGGGGSGAGGAS